MHPSSVQQRTSARIPTREGEFRLALYQNSLDDKDHLALIYGEIESETDVLVRVHSECFTGDVLGSLRCDCGEQLNTSMRMIAEHGAGVILYLRQEGRGIGLFSKLQAYNLQDDGYDTVEANLALGHGADERDYTIGGLILKDLGVRSVRLITNNPDKIESLEAFGLNVAERIPIQPHLNRHNTDYLRAKVERMQHMLDLDPERQRDRRTNRRGGVAGPSRQRMEAVYRQTGRPFVTVSYAQSLDGSIAAQAGTPLPISSADSLSFTHRMRAAHDAILVGIGTLLADDPQLTVRLVDGEHPRPVVLDTQLRFPLSARLLDGDTPRPIIATNQKSDAARRGALEAAGARVLRLPCNDNEGVSIAALLDALAEREIRSLMVEGGARVITSFMRRRLVDHLAVTVAPILVGGLQVLRGLPFEGEEAADAGVSAFPRLSNVRYRWLGSDLVIQGDPVWEEQRDA